MTNLDILRQRLYSQRLSGASFKAPEDVVRWFGAVQAQDYSGSLWAVGLRVVHATEGTIEQAIAERKIVRTWPMRGTIHFVPPEDAAWMLKLLSPRVTVRTANVYRQVGLDEEIFAQSAEVLAKALQGGKRLARKELYATLERSGIPTGGSRGLHISGQLALRGLICFGPREGKQPTFVLLDEWAPNAKRLEGEEAVAELALRYFTSHGPATVQDFAWWSGLTMPEAKSGLAMVQAQFSHQDIESRRYWFRPSSGLKPSSPIAHLLPPYDEYTVAYKDRSAAVDPHDIKGAGYGIGPNIMIDGRIIGTWKRTLKKDTVMISLSPFTPLTKSQNAAIAIAADRYSKFINMPVILSR